MADDREQRVIDELVEEEVGYVPYSARMPRSDDLHLLREELSLQIELRGRGSSQAQEAFENLFRTSCRIGRPLDGLKRASPVESERFFALIRNGTDAHIYWLGANGGFRLNDGRYAKPNRWWWMYQNGVVSQYHDIFPDCGQEKCINPEHQASGRDLRRRIFSDSQMLGAIQVVTMRNDGKPPRVKQWQEEGHRPSANVYKRRFGSWVDALVAAGVINGASDMPRASPVGVATPERVVASLREARRFLGHIPREREYQHNKELHDHLRDLRLITSQTTVKKHLGSWRAATERAFGT